MLFWNLISANNDSFPAKGNMPPNCISSLLRKPGLKLFKAQTPKNQTLTDYLVPPRGHHVIRARPSRRLIRRRCRQR